MTVHDSHPNIPHLNLECTYVHTFFTSLFGLQKFVAKILLFSWVGSFDVLQTLNGHFIITSVYIIKILMTNSTSFSHEHTSAHDALSIWQDLHSLMFIHMCSVLKSSLPFTNYLKSHNCVLPKDTFLVHSSHNFTQEKWIKIPLLFITTVASESPWAISGVESHYILLVG
jgi:hypothetical protein